MHNALIFLNHFPLKITNSHQLLQPMLLRRRIEVFSSRLLHDRNRRKTVNGEAFPKAILVKSDKQVPLTSMASSCLGEKTRQ